MLPRQPHPQDSSQLDEIMAINLLRACPSQIDNMNLSPDDKKHLCEFRRTIGQCSRQNLRLSSSRMHRITCHERCLLNSIAALQQEQEDIATTHLEWLVPSWALPSVRLMCGEISAIFLKQNINLVWRKDKPPVRRDHPALYAVIG